MYCVNTANRTQFENRDKYAKKKTVCVIQKHQNYVIKMIFFFRCQTTFFGDWECKKAEEKLLILIFAQNFSI